MAASPAKPAITIRPLETAHDRACIFDIDRASFEKPWSDAELSACLRKPTVFCSLAVVAKKIVGFLIFEILQCSTIEIVLLAVEPFFRRRGVGRSLVESVAARLRPNMKSRLGATVRETNVDAIKFFMANDFHLVRLERGMYVAAPGRLEDGVRLVRYCKSLEGE
jgi:ribosomal-protein-alanine N-acetyltransferase